MEPLTKVTEISVVYRSEQKATERRVISHSAEAHRVLLEAFNPDTIAIQEQFVAAYLTRSNEVLGVYKVSTGGITGTVADPRLIIGVALKLAAVGLMIAHNHPGGTMRPSRMDEELTQKIKEGCRYLDLKLLDHLIISPCGKRYYSFADEGLV